MMKRLIAFLLRRYGDLSIEPSCEMGKIAVVMGGIEIYRRPV